MQEFFDSQKTLKRFADLMSRRLARDGINLPFPALLEAVSAGLEAKNWNEVAAELPKEPSTARQRGEMALKARQLRSDMGTHPFLESQLRDWRETAGDTDAMSELREDDRLQWKTDVYAFGQLGMEFHDPVADAGEAPAEARAASRSVSVSFELDRGVPKAMLAPLGADNLAVVWLTGDRLVMELAGENSRLLVVEPHGSRFVPSSEIDFTELGSPQGGTTSAPAAKR